MRSEDDGSDQSVRIDTHRGCDGSEPLAVVARAIDELAAEDPGLMTYAEMAGRVARVWALIGSIDPELARRAARYAPNSSNPRSDADDLDV